MTMEMYPVIQQVIQKTFFKGILEVDGANELGVLVSKIPSQQGAKELSTYP